MLKIIPTGRFHKDYARMKRRGKDMNKLTTIVDRLALATPLDKRHRDHALSGDWDDCRECHVEPDWLLIYKVAADELHLIRTGSHSDLFR